MKLFSMHDLAFLASLAVLVGAMATSDKVEAISLAKPLRFAASAYIQSPTGARQPVFGG